MKMIDRPRSLKERITSKRTSVSLSVSEEVGSSMAIRSDLKESALATSTICLSAMLRSCTLAWASTFRLSWSSSTWDWA